MPLSNMDPGTILAMAGIGSLVIVGLGLIAGRVADNVQAETEEEKPSRRFVVTTRQGDVIDYRCTKAATPDDAAKAQLAKGRDVLSVQETPDSKANQAWW